MACFAALLILIAVTFYGGQAVLYCIHKTGSGTCAAMVTGSVVLFFYMLVWQIITVKLRLPFSVMKLAGSVYFVVVLAVGVFLWCRTVKARRQLPVMAGERKQMLIMAGVVFVFVLNVCSMLWYEPYFGSDMTVEEVGTILATDTVCRYHPGTGAQLRMGMNVSAQLNCVPGLYAILCGLTGAETYLFVCRFVPVWGLLVNYAAVYLLLRQVYCFRGSEQRSCCKERLGCGLLLYGVLVLMGDYQPYTYAFRLLHQGWNPGVLLGADGGLAALNGLVCMIRVLHRRKEGRAIRHAKCVE